MIKTIKQTIQKTRQKIESHDMRKPESAQKTQR